MKCNFYANVLFRRRHTAIETYKAYRNADLTFNVQRTFKTFFDLAFAFIVVFCFFV